MSQPVPDHDQRNLLAGEASPYLRQHASNPVHWRPWSKAALDEARSTGKPVLLSIGYAACHWCHVMAHESFEDPAVAEVMNRLFVNIKVDREERPDIDQIYMTALTAMGEQGGWPMTMFLTPDGEPFWGGTYFPRQARYGRPGFIDILNAVHDLFLNEKDRIALNAGAIRSHLASSLAGHADRAALSPAHADTVADRIAGMIDTSNGGIRGAPKFPNAPFIEALWLSWLRTGNEAHRDACLLTWRHMLDGGIYDHLGGGMARYSVDDRWLAPHFEKMLYDNAQMIRHALWAWHATGDHLFRMRIEETAGWLAREMLLPSGAFASSLDADSEGEEGRFYVWSADELRTALGSDYDLFASHYDVTREGNWEGHTIPNRLHAETPARDSPVEEKLARLRERLLLVRARRVRPGRDDKALTDWNGLAIRAMAEAGRTLQRSDWIALARNAYQAVVAAADDDRLPHSTMPGARSTTGLASDYAAMINAAVSLCEATLDPAYLDDARRLHGSLDRWHAMGADGYSQTATDRRDVILHIRGDQDDATPSATAQIIEALARLATITGDEALAARSIELAEYAVGRALDKTFGHVGIINAATIAADPWKLVVVEPGEGDRPLMAEAARSPDPRRCDLFVPLGASPVALPAGTVAETHRSAAWLCRGHTCLLPVTEAEKLAVMLADR